GDCLGESRLHSPDQHGTATRRTRPARRPCHGPARLGVRRSDPATAGRPQGDGMTAAAVARRHALDDPWLDQLADRIWSKPEVTDDANAEAFVRCLKAYEPEVVVMASFDQILKAETLAVPKRGWLNIHPSLLPRHRGPEPIYWTIANGDRKGGISVHLTVPRIDAGPILAQRRVAVSADDTAGTLARRLVAEGLPALDATLAALETGAAQPIR